MAEAEPVPIERASFPNNVDMLVFEDRCEYRTHSRAGYFVAGVIGCVLAAVGIWFCIYMLVISPAQAGRFASDERTFGYDVSAIVLPLSGLILWVGANSFRSEELAERFKTLFLTSMKEMATRSLGDAVPTPALPEGGRW